MRLFRFVSLILVHVVGAVVYCSRGLAEPTHPVHVSVSAEDCTSGGECRLTIAITNRDSVAIVTSYQSLPWRNPGALVFVGAYTNSGETLQSAVPLDQRFPERVTLQPNETVTGTVKLKTWFPKLETERIKGDVLIAWVYEMYSYDLNRFLEPVCGALILKKTALK